MGQSFFDILMWTIVAAMLVLIVINAKTVGSGILSPFFSFWTKETTILTGTNYNLAK